MDKEFEAIYDKWVEETTKKHISIRFKKEWMPNKLSDEFQLRDLCLLSEDEAMSILTHLNDGCIFQDYLEFSIVLCEVSQARLWLAEIYYIPLQEVHIWPST